MRLLLATICTACLLTAACDGDTVRISSTTTDSGPTGGVLKVIETLQCPEAIGVLTRKGSAHSGGDVCVYSGPRGAEVSLHLIKLDNQTADSVLVRFEADLAADMPHTSADLRASAEAERARAAAETARVQADIAQVAAETARAEAEASASSSGTARIQGPGMRIESDGDRADVRLPGMSVQTGGDRASVRFGGFSIEADDSNQTARISSSDDSVSIEAHDDAAQIRTRAAGDAIRTTYLLTDNRPADAGWRMVGYEARGPAGGPIVVATVRSKDRDSDGVFDSAKDLVALNIGE
ncbi:MAG: methyltransferase type 11 [Alphaproteobacteria bacterium]|nr:methyltransferase type 11 [Alphaproteobacteria bacterium]MBU2380020.1 methyltransferase type 11 [Alphaproteobacteria bacterium]